MLPAGAALDRILEHTGYLALAATTPGGVEAGDLLHAVDRVRQVVEEGGSLADAADALEADSEATNEVESLPLEPGRSDVVRVMNLHKAKGLEAAVVFLADPCGGVNPRSTCTSSETEPERLAGSRSGADTRARRFDGLRAPGRARGLGEAQAGRAALSGSRGDPAVLRRRHSRATRCSSSAGTRATPEPGVGPPGQCPRVREGAARARQGEGPQPKPATCSTQAQVAAAHARATADSRVNHPSWSITSATAEAKHIATMVAPSVPRRH